MLEVNTLLSLDLSCNFCLVRVATASVTDASSRMTTLAEEIKSLMDIGCTLRRAEELAVQDRARCKFIQLRSVQ